MLERTEQALMTMWRIRKRESLGKYSVSALGSWTEDVAAYQGRADRGETEQDRFRGLWGRPREDFQ